MIINTLNTFHMRKDYLLVAAGVMSAMTINAADPEGDLYILGLNGVTTPDASNTLVMQERSEDDIDEGVWRWALDSFDIVQTEGSFTVSDGKSLTLGFDAENVFGFANEMTEAQSMVYMAVDGPAINYTLPAGECKIMVALFADIDGDFGKDTWIVQIQSAASNTDDSYYLFGFDGVESPASAYRFKKIEEEIDGETVVTYSIPKFLVEDCPYGFSVYSSADDAILGLSTDFAAPDTPVTDESPLAFLSAGGEKVICNLSEGYYTVTFASMGAFSMISFIRCEDQTPLDEMEYYLVGANGVTELSDACKFKREVVIDEYEDEGVVVEEVSINYSLAKFDYKSAESGIYVVSSDGVVVFGYNSDMAVAFPNDLTEEMPFAIMAVNGDALNCSMPAGEYDISFSVTGNGTGMITFMASETESVDAVDVAESQEIYYDLNGRIVRNPQKGIFVVKKGSEVKKIIR